MSTVLEQICAVKETHIERMKAQTTLDELKERCKDAPKPLGFIDRIKNFNNESYTFITEVKKASPSKGVIREDFEPVEIAKIYEANNAACLSVLTDEKYFQGHDDYFTAIRAAVNIPMLRKDFMIDPYQIHESRAMGADCILLIMACLSDELAAELYALSTDLGMDVLVEIHDAEELERALKLSPQMVGVNNRNLKTLEVDLKTGLNLAASMPSNILRIGESGLHSNEQIQQFSTVGFDAFLIGESLMREDDIATAIKILQKR